MIVPLFYYLGTIISWVDGDTVSVLVDQGFKTYSEKTFRLIGSEHPIDAYEIRDRDPAKRLLARQGWDLAKELAPHGSVVVIRSLKGPRVDGFRRYIAEVLNEQGVNIGDTLLSRGLATIWKG